MSLIYDILARHLPAKHQTSNKGWKMFNAVCCHHRGHRPDTRMRGNMLFAPTGIIAYNCYNCGLKTKFDGYKLSRTFENLMIWLGIADEDINRIKLELMQNRLQGNNNLVDMQDIRFSTDFNEINLPEKAVSFESILSSSDIPDQFISTLSYLDSRGIAILNGWDYFWSPSSKWDLNNRVIIPFYRHDKIVGWTARYAGVPPAGMPRYYNSHLQPGYLFNCDILDLHNREFVLVTEGPFDAIAVSGIGVLGSELSKEQITWLNSTDAEKIIVPDRQLKNQGLINAAIEQRWSVCFPEWEDDVKDAAQASQRYGKLFTIRSAIASKTNSILKIGIKRKMFKL